MGQIVFEDELLRKKLERILHPLVKEEIRRFFHQQTKRGEKIAYVSVPLLFEAKFEKLFDKIILTYANDEIRIERLIKRSNLSSEQAHNRIKIQMSQNKKILLADYVLYNNSDLKNLEKEVKNLVLRICGK